MLSGEGCVSFPLYLAEADVLKEPQWQWQGQDVLPGNLPWQRLQWGCVTSSPPYSSFWIILQGCANLTLRQLLCLSYSLLFLDL